MTMYGRLGMTGAAVGRGDKDVWKAIIPNAHMASTKVLPRTKAFDVIPNQHMGPGPKPKPRKQSAFAPMIGKEFPHMGRVYHPMIKPHPLQLLHWGAAAGAIGVGGTVAHRQRKKAKGPIKKKDNSRRNAMIAGGVTGAAAVDLGLAGSGYLVREHIKRTMNREQFKPNKARRKMMQEHRIKHGGDESAGKRPIKYYTNYPENVPLSRTQRAMGWKNHPGVKYGSIAAGGVLGAMAMKHKMDKDRRITKADDRWQNRSKKADAVRNVGFGGATLATGALLATRSPRVGRFMDRTRGLKKLNVRHLEVGSLGGATVGGSAAMYGEYARHRKHKAYGME